VSLLPEEVTVNVVMNAATLVVLVGAIWRAAKWTERVDIERKLEHDTNTKAFDSIKATLGNGAPGTVVRTTVCEALHAAIKSDLTVVRDDIRDLRDVVQSKL
jgi:hypothetical protein